MTPSKLCLNAFHHLKKKIFSTILFILKGTFACRKMLDVDVTVISWRRHIKIKRYNSGLLNEIWTLTVEGLGKGNYHQIIWKSSEINKGATEQ